MATDVVMPQMGESIAEGTIVRWIKKVGEKVDRDEPLFEISTDKVDAEIPSPAAGVVSEIRVKEGETVAVNSVVAVIGGPTAQTAKTAPAKEPLADIKAAEPPAPSSQADGSRRRRRRRRRVGSPVGVRADAAGPATLRRRPKTRSANGRRRSSGRSPKSIRSISRRFMALASLAA